MLFSKLTVIAHWVGTFLAVQDSSIEDLVTHSLTQSVSERLLISAFTMTMMTTMTTITIKTTMTTVTTVTAMSTETAI